jgi:hypothetical protein
MHDETSDSETEVDTEPPPARKPYATPKLISYGHVKDVVQGANGMMVDASGSRSKTCWIAEALYGVDDPRTLLVRAWLATVLVERRPGWRFVELYGRVGAATAALIRRGILPRQLFRRLFDRLFEQALDHSADALAARR